MERILPPMEERAPASRKKKRGKKKKEKRYELVTQPASLNPSVLVARLILKKRVFDFVQLAIMIIKLIDSLNAHLVDLL